MRNSTHRTEHRELLAGEKQRKGFVELASEHLPEIFIYLYKRVDADGVRRYPERI